MVSLQDYARFDAVGLAAAIRCGEVSRREVMDAALSAAEKTASTVAALVETWDDRTSDAYLDSVPDGPFTGVPFVIKDAVLHEAGRPVEFGSALCAGVSLPHDTELMIRFRATGLATFGRSKSPEMAFNITTEPRFHGPARNPWSLEHSTGGSSGGAAAAVAAGIVPIAHANDGGGSTRIPAAQCGLVGLKPSRGRVPIGPDASEGLNGLGAELVVSRSVRDTAVMLDAVHGLAPGDPYDAPPAPDSYAVLVERAAPGPLRIGLPRLDWCVTPIDPQVQAAWDQTANLLERLGHHVEPVDLPLGVDWDRFIWANAIIWCSNLARWVTMFAAATGRPVSLDTLEPPTLACTRTGQAASAADVLTALDVFNTVSRSFGAVFARLDAALLPCLPTPPYRLGVHQLQPDDGTDGFGWTEHLFTNTPFTPAFNVTGQPAMSLPLAWSQDGLPIGMQFAAPLGREDTLLTLAAQIEQAQPWADKHAPHGVWSA